MLRNDLAMKIRVLSYRIPRGASRLPHIIRSLFSKARAGPEGAGKGGACLNAEKISEKRAKTRTPALLLHAPQHLYRIPKHLPNGSVENGRFFKSLLSPAAYEKTR